MPYLIFPFFENYLKPKKREKREKSHFHLKRLCFFYQCT